MNRLNGGLLAVSLAVFSAGCEMTEGFSGPASRYPAKWTNVDQYDRQWPAYAYARHGMLEEARAIVARGEDTQAHYNQGEMYWNYWSKHSATADTGVTDNDVMHDMTNDIFNSNDSRYKDLKERAANGDVEAQNWLRKNGETWEAGNNAARSLNRE